MKKTGDLPPLPRRMRSMDGQDVNTSGMVIKLRSSADGGCVVTINLAMFDPAMSMFSPRAAQLVKLYLIGRIQKRKARTIESDFHSLRRFDQWLRRNRPTPRALKFEWSDLDESMARAFLAHGISNTADKGNDLSRLRTFYRWGVAHQHRGFKIKTSQDLKAIRAIGNSKGHNVRFHHPTKGPLSPDEKLLIYRACLRDMGTIYDRAVVLLHLELGLNPNSAARIKKSDFKMFSVNAVTTYQLDVPRVKKRTTKRQIKRRSISQRLGGLIQSSQKENSDPNAPLFHWLSETHPEADINAAMRRFVRDARIKSPRTGRLLALTPRRFRTTLGTHMAEEGASKFHIAEILDHTDLQNVGVYTETVSSIADAVANATDAQMGPLVDRFLGRIVNSLDSLERNQVVPRQSPHVSLPILNMGGVGGCGRDPQADGLCDLFPPLSCYLCPFFAALRSGPHREVLDSLEAYVRKNETSSDPRILRQLDDIIIAIRTVLKKLGQDSLEVTEVPT